MHGGLASVAARGAHTITNTAVSTHADVHAVNSAAQYGLMAHRETAAGRDTGASDGRGPTE